MTDMAWKADEREAAKNMGVERIPVSGRQRDKHGADFEDGLVMVQNKRGYKHASVNLVREWLDGIRATAACHEKIGVVRWRKANQRHKDALVVMTWGDFIELHGLPANNAKTSMATKGEMGDEVRHQQR